jgi:uncharacterized protein YneF (UPF0154 family)
MEDASTLLHMVETLGFPIFIAVILIGGIYFMMKWMMSTLMGKITANQEITIKLIDRVRALDNSVVRLEAMIRIIHDLNLNWDVLGKLEKEDRRID